MLFLDQRSGRQRPDLTTRRGAFAVAEVFENAAAAPAAGSKPIEGVLRLAVAGEFLGHGLFAFSGNPAWVPFITLFGFPPEAAFGIMRAIGVLDISLALCVLIKPWRPAVAWMAFWGFFTALLRPLSGGSWLGFVERGANWGAPLALWLLLSRREAAAAGLGLIKKRPK